MVLIVISVVIVSSSAQEPFFVRFSRFKKDLSDDVTGGNLILKCAVAWRTADGGVSVHDDAANYHTGSS